MVRRDTQPIHQLVTNPAAGPSLSGPELPVFEYRKPRHQRGGGWKMLRILALVLVVAGVGVGGWVAYKGLAAAHNIISKSNGIAPALAGALDPTKLKGEGDGRINILVLGIGGQGHEGPNLSDTIMVWSIDPKTKDVAALSIPRDLYVKIPAAGKYRTQYGKINAANAYGGQATARKVVESVIGMPIHYYATIDFSGFKQAVDAVGGVDIQVEKALYDGSFPCERGSGYCPFRIAAGMQHMNGTTALRYARSRHSTSDFDRARRQQQVIVALRKKALDASTLTNPIKIAQLMDAVGGHFKTDLQMKEITKLAKLAKDIDTTKVVNKVLDTAGPDSLLVDGSGRIAGAGSIELPRKGNYDYSDIWDFVKNIFVDHYITDENARLEVQNGSGVAGAASGVVKSLKAAHYNVLTPTNAADRYTKTVIYDYSGGKKPYTVHYLERRFNVKVQRATAPVAQTDAAGNALPSPQIRIILGSDFASSLTSQ